MQTLLWLLEASRMRAAATCIHIFNHKIYSTKKVKLCRKRKQLSNDLVLDIFVDVAKTVLNKPGGWQVICTIVHVHCSFNDHHHHQKVPST